MTQKDLSDWIEDWHQYLTPVDDEGSPTAHREAETAKAHRG